MYVDIVRGKAIILCKPFSATMGPLIENILEKEETLKKYAWMATMETIKGSLNSGSHVAKTQEMTILQGFLAVSRGLTRVWDRSKRIY